MPKKIENNELDTFALERNAFFSNNNEIDTLRGDVSDDIIFQLNNTKSEEEIEQELYRRLKRYEKNGEILWGMVSGVESLGNHAVACVSWNGLKITIPEEDYIEPYFDMGNNYKSMDEGQKFKKRLGILRYQIGAVVPFCVTHVERNPITEGPHMGEFETTTLGSRVSAMKIMRDIYFFHKNRKTTELPPRTVNVGDKIQAHVLAVKEDSVLIECCGKETRLGAHNLLPTEVVENCTDYVRPGMTLTVKVKKVLIGEDSVDIAVTGRTYTPSKAIRNIKKGGMYLGVVELADDKREIYTIILNFNGIKAMVPYAHVKGQIPLLRGDIVQFFANAIYDEFVAGSAQKQY